ncbi:MAG: hypothetical protein ABI707_11240 [Ferruginibacter sp.]
MGCLKIPFDILVNSRQCIEISAFTLQQQRPGRIGYSAFGIYMEPAQIALAALKNIPVRRIFNQANMVPTRWLFPVFLYACLTVFLLHKQ